MASGFDQMMKGLGALAGSMKEFAQTRAISHAQDEINSLNAMEMDEMAKRQQQQMIAQNLTLNLAKTGGDLQSAAAIIPKQLNTTDQWIQQSRTDELNQKAEDKKFQKEKWAFDRETALQVAGLKAAGGVNRFRGELQKQTAKDFAKELESLDSLGTGITDVDDAITALDKFGKNTLGGTGALATGFGFKKYLSQDAENLEAKFKKINLGNMATTFKGMSKAIDTGVEREAWEATQADLKNDDKTNAAILLGAKSLMLKQAFEIQQKADYADQHGSLEGYRSNLSKVVSVVSKEGQMKLVQKSQLPDFLKEGYQTADEFAKKSFGKVSVKRSSFGEGLTESTAPSQETPKQQSTTPPPAAGSRLLKHIIRR